MRAKLQQLRKSNGYTQQTFSAAVGTSRSHYAQIETGDKQPALRLALRIEASAELLRRRHFRQHHARGPEINFFTQLRPEMGHKGQREAKERRCSRQASCLNLK